jgi:hypothetical protein
MTDECNGLIREAPLQAFVVEAVQYAHRSVSAAYSQYDVGQLARRIREVVDLRRALAIRTREALKAALRCMDTLDLVPLLTKPAERTVNDSRIMRIAGGRDQFDGAMHGHK